MPEKTIDEILQKLIDNCETDDWHCEYSQVCFVNTFVLNISPVERYPASVINIQTGTFNTDKIYFLIDDVMITCEDNNHANLLSILFKRLMIKQNVFMNVHNKAIVYSKIDIIRKNLQL